jgi:hypothetical protein
MLWQIRGRFSLHRGIVAANPRLLASVALIIPFACVRIDRGADFDATNPITLGS